MPIPRKNVRRPQCNSKGRMIKNTQKPLLKLVILLNPRLHVKYLLNLGSQLAPGPADAAHPYHPCSCVHRRATRWGAPWRCSRRRAWVATTGPGGTPGCVGGAWCAGGTLPGASGRMAGYSGYFCSGPAGFGREPHVFPEHQRWGVWACPGHFVPSTGMMWAQISGISCRFAGLVPHRANNDSILARLGRMRRFGTGILNP